MLLSYLLPKDLNAPKQCCVLLILHFLNVLDLSLALYYVRQNMSTRKFALFYIALSLETDNVILFCCEVPDLAIPYGTTEAPDRNTPSVRPRSLPAPGRQRVFCRS